MNTEKEIQKFPESIILVGDIDKNIVLIDGQLLDLEASLKVRNHSPSGFSWGYGGSGPAQLALAILLKYASQDFALKYYQDFKFSHIAALERDNIYKKFFLRDAVRHTVNSKVDKL